MSDAFWMGLFALFGTIVTAATSIAVVMLAKMNKKLDLTHDLVNSASEKINKLTGDAKFAEGKIVGAAEQKGADEEAAAELMEPQKVVVVNEPSDPVPTTEGQEKEL